MSQSVPYVTDQAIENDAAVLLSGYERERGVTLTAPLPIEDIIEKHLKLRIDFDDMHARYRIPRPPKGQPDILGAIYGDGSIFIDESLDPETYPASESRYRFTLAHEGAHWRLHKQLFIHDTAQTSFLDAAGEPKFICRSSNVEDRAEWQANFYASCLLMPRKMLFAAWDEFFPDRKQRVLGPSTPFPNSFVEIPRRRLSNVILESEVESLERFCVPLAKRFLVSPTAMRIRLEKLGLLHRTVPLQRLLSYGS